MERVVTLSRSFREADQRTREQYWAMTPLERLVLARQLVLQVWGDDCPDVRQAGPEWQGIKRLSKDLDDLENLPLPPP